MQLSQEALLVRRLAAAGDGNNIVEIKTESGGDMAWKLAQLGIIAKKNDVKIHSSSASPTFPKINLPASSSIDTTDATAVSTASQHKTAPDPKVTQAGPFLKVMKTCIGDKLETSMGDNYTNTCTSKVDSASPLKPKKLPAPRLQTGAKVRLLDIGRSSSSGRVRQCGDPRRPRLEQIMAQVDTSSGARAELGGQVAIRTNIDSKQTRLKSAFYGILTSDSELPTFVRGEIRKVIGGARAEVLCQLLDHHHEVRADTQHLFPLPSQARDIAPLCVEVILAGEKWGM